MSKTFKACYEEVRNKPFIITGPIVMRDTERDLDIGVACDTDSSGRAIKYDPSKIDVFGVSIVAMATAYDDGLSFSLYDRHDLPRLVSTMEEFLKVTESAMRSINFRKIAPEDIDLIFSFGKNVVSLNERIKRGENVEIKKVIAASGFVTPEMGVKNVTKEIDTPISASARRRIKRFKPRN